MVSSPLRAVASVGVGVLSVLLSSLPTRAADDALRVILRDGFLPGVPVLVRAELRHEDGSLAREVWDEVASVTVGDESPVDFPLFCGIGSALIRIDATADTTVTVRVGDEAVSRELLHRGDDSVTTVAGALAGDLVEWSGVVHVTGDLDVPAGTLLRVAPGTLVMLDGVTDGENGTDIDVDGAIECLGTEDRPVTFTAADPDRAWGEIDHNPSSRALYRYTEFTRGGNSPRGGHTNSGPVLRTEDATLELVGSSITDAAGKAMTADGSELRFEESLIARCVMGPEIDGTALEFTSSYITEMYGEDDNDGIYVHSQVAGQIVHLSGGVVASGHDDGIDTLGSDVTIEDMIVRDWADKGVSVFHDDVAVLGSILTGNDIGISAKSADGDSARITIDRTTIALNRVGIQARDKSGEPDADIRFFVSNTIVAGVPQDDAAAIETDYDPADIIVTYSDIETGWPGEGNLDIDPEFVAMGARDFRLAAGSPCIDAGDPASTPDADGSRADMGARPLLVTGPATFRRGQLSGDGALDISDAIRGLLYLFSGAEIDCVDAADVDDDGSVNLTDPVALLLYLFQSGNVPAEPFASCGVDPTDDDLTCDRPTCR